MIKRSKYATARRSVLSQLVHMVCDDHAATLHSLTRRALVGHVTAVQSSHVKTTDNEWQLICSSPGVRVSTPPSHLSFSLSLSLSVSLRLRLNRCVSKYACLELWQCLVHGVACLGLLVIITSCARGDTICLRPLQVDNIFAIIRQVAPLPACWLFNTPATS